MGVQKCLNSSISLESNTGKALVSILSIIAVASASCAGLFFGGAFDVQEIVSKNTTEKPKTTEYVHPMFKGVEKKGVLYIEKPKLKNKKNQEKLINKKNQVYEPCCLQTTIFLERFYTLEEVKTN